MQGEFPMRHFYKFCATVFVWYFIASSGTSHIQRVAQTQGPFPNKKTCESIKNSLRAFNLTPCWSVGRDVPSPESEELQDSSDSNDTERD